MQYSSASTKHDEEQEFNLNDKKCLTGPVVVTRNPCLHPGDVRQFEAVAASTLGHLVDCIVFPQRGSRPHTDEMAGKLILVCIQQQKTYNKLKIEIVESTKFKTLLI